MSSEQFALPSRNSKQSGPVRVRVAPSPTGDPHVGTAYIGLLNYLFAKQRGGAFVLRIEDTDRTRFVSTSEQMIFDALRWVGLRWDEGPDVGGPHGPYRQSERTEIYREYCDKLVASGHAYRAFETPEELEAERKEQTAAKLPPKYNGPSRNYTPAQAEAALAEGKAYTVRLRVPDGDKPAGTASTTFRDELRGDITFDHVNVDDQVLLKSDGYPTYHLANVVDDHLMGITDVIRAEEWISSTPKHVLLYQAFGWDVPRFWHMPLLRNVDKSKISKRKNPVSLIYYRQAGYLPEALLNFLGLMGGGMAQPTEQEIVSKGLDMKLADVFSLADMLERYDFHRISLGGPVFDLTKLKWLNGEYLRAMSGDAFFEALRQTIFSDSYLREIAPLVQTRIETLAQFGDMADFFFKDDVQPSADLFVPKKRTVEEALRFTEGMLTVLESAVWDAEVINMKLREWLMVRSVTDISEPKQAEWSVKEAFMLLRAIVTGKTASPPLLESLIVFGKARTLDRMRRFLDAQKKALALAGRGQVGHRTTHLTRE
ncbi:glutamate--tRNA ligase [Terriglobus sp.]|uniref:glutamate--tRNA ligase n=1 Tax=Terriglobus sp. TaxID=1889013 RepID=UPI003B00FC00